MTRTDPLRCTFEDARRVHLLHGMALDTRAKIAFFEEMVSFAAHFGARDRLAERRAEISAAHSQARADRQGDA